MPKARSSVNGCRLHQTPFSAISFAVGFVEQLTVVDAFHPGFDRLPHGARRVGMHGDIGAPVFGGFDRRAQFRRRCIA